MKNSLEETKQLNNQSASKSSQTSNGGAQISSNANLTNRQLSDIIDCKEQFN